MSSVTKLVLQSVCGSVVRLSMVTVADMLSKLQLESWLPIFEEEDLTHVSLLQSMGPMLLPNLAELGLEAADAIKIQKELVDLGVAEPSGGAPDEDSRDVMLEEQPNEEDAHHRKMRGRNEERKPGSEEGDVEVEEVEPKHPSNVVHLSKEEYERMMEESDDDDTPQAAAVVQLYAGRPQLPLPYYCCTAAVVQSSHW